MSRLEEQILQCLIVDGRAPFRRIGEVVGVSEQTVARRYRSMREDGRIHVVVGRSGFSERRRTWWVRLHCRPDAAVPLAEALAARTDASHVALVSGGSEVTCRISGPIDDATGVLERLPNTGAVLSFTAQALLRPFASSTSEWTMFDQGLDPARVGCLATDSVRHRERSDTASSEDEPLIARLSEDGRSTGAALARDLGWPLTRVTSRLESLFSDGTLFLATDFLPEAFGYRATAILHLTVPPRRLVEIGETLAGHAETGFVAATTGSANLLAVVTCRSFDDLFVYVTARVGALPDVQHVEVVPYLRRIKQSVCRVVDGRLRDAA